MISCTVSQPRPVRAARSLTVNHPTQVLDERLEPARVADIGRGQRGGHFESSAALPALGIWAPPSPGNRLEADGHGCNAEAPPLRLTFWLWHWGQTSCWAWTTAETDASHPDTRCPILLPLPHSKRNEKEDFDSCPNSLSQSSFQTPTFRKNQLLFGS